MKITLEQFVAVVEQRTREFVAKETEREGFNIDATDAVAHWWELWTDYMDKNNLWDTGIKQEEQHAATNPKKR